eukprot:1159129-Pelagomonas_calceolata.AAC.10
MDPIAQGPARAQAQPMQSHARWTLCTVHTWMHAMKHNTLLLFMCSVTLRVKAAQSDITTSATGAGGHRCQCCWCAAGQISAQSSSSQSCADKEHTELCLPPTPTPWSCAYNDIPAIPAQSPSSQSCANREHTELCLPHTHPPSPQHVAAPTCGPDKSRAEASDRTAGLVLQIRLGLPVRQTVWRVLQGAAKFNALQLLCLKPSNAMHTGVLLQEAHSKMLQIVCCTSIAIDLLHLLHSP